ncbi:MAG: diguanylate cyclase [Litoreibacter sp.]|nr:diguanylate cyclase [Litoreibacter sp.]
MGEVCDDIVTSSVTALDALMPLHLSVDPSGVITHVGPTMQKLHPEGALSGMRFMDVFELRRPVNAPDFCALWRRGSCGVKIRFRDGERFGLKGLFTRLSGGSHGLINLSLGISVLDAVRCHNLVAADFAPSDPTVDMLYLIEAKTAALDESKRLNQRLQGAKVAAEEQAFSDTLTGLKNRRALDHLMTRMARSSTPFGLMTLDLDYFKQVNDTFGHAAGDYVLQRVAEILVSETRSGDMVARVGGDEFILAFQECVDPRILNSIASRIISRLEQPIDYDGQSCRISASIGITLSSFYADPVPEQMLGDADVALYWSKHKGRACHTIFDPGTSSESVR